MSAKAATKEFVATGRRKTSTARVRIKEGTGKFSINNRPHTEYCTTEQQKKMIIALWQLQRNPVLLMLLSM